MRALGMTKRLKRLYETKIGQEKKQPKVRPEMKEGELHQFEKVEKIKVGKRKIMGKKMVSRKNHQIKK